MSKIDNNNALLREEAGKGKIDIFEAGQGMSGADYFKIHFPVATVLDSIDAANIVNGSALSLRTLEIPADTTIRMRVTEINVASGIAICYTENDGDTSN